MQPGSTRAHAKRGFGLMCVTLAFLGGVSTAEAATIGDCTVEALTPTPVRVTQSGTKTANGRASLVCTQAHTSNGNHVELDIHLYGEDPISDDLQVPGKNNVFVMPGVSQVLTAKINTGAQSCNEDRPGADELYSRVRARIHTNGVPSAWSAWDRGRTVRYNCG